MARFLADLEGKTAAEYKIHTLAGTIIPVVYIYIYFFCVCFQSVSVFCVCFWFCFVFIMVKQVTQSKSLY